MDPPAIARAAGKCRVFWTIRSHFHLEQSEAMLERLIILGQDAVGVGSFSHKTNTTEPPFTTPFALHPTVKDGASTALKLYEVTDAVANAFGL